MCLVGFPSLQNGCAVDISQTNGLDFDGEQAVALEGVVAALAGQTGALLVPDVAVRGGRVDTLTGVSDQCIAWLA